MNTPKRKVKGGRKAARVAVIWDSERTGLWYFCDFASPVLKKSGGGYATHQEAVDAAIKRGYTV